MSLRLEAHHWIAGGIGLAVGVCVGGYLFYGAGGGGKTAPQVEAPLKDGSPVVLISIEKKWHLWATSHASAMARVNAWGMPDKPNLVLYRERGPNIVLLDPGFTAKGGKVAVVWLEGSLGQARIASIVPPSTGRDGFIASNQEVFASIVLPEGAELGGLAKGDALKIVY